MWLNPRPGRVVRDDLFHRCVTHSIWLLWIQKLLVDEKQLTRCCFQAKEYPPDRFYCAMK